MNDLERKMEESQILVIDSNLDQVTSSMIIYDLMRWNENSETSEINIYLTSGSYDFMSVMAIYDVLTSIKNPISIYCVANIGGYYPILLTTATKGRRFALKHTEIRLEQPIAFFKSGSNQQTEIEIIANEATKQREIIESILSEKLNKPIEEIHSVLEESKKFSASEALEYGLIDKILGETI